MNKKILFIQPSIYDDKGKVVKKRKLYFVGLAYPILATLLPEGWTCDICIETIEKIPYNTDADVIGIGGMGHAANRGKDIAAEFKKRGKIVFMGGPMVSLVPDLAKQFCDSVMIGDSEETMAELCHDLEKGQLKPFYKKPLTSLSYPLPRYDLVLNKHIGDFLPVQAGRGCPNSCKFCSIYCIYRNKYLKRPIDEVIRDIKYVKSLGFKKFLLIDDNIVADEEYMFELCKRIKPLKMKWMSQCAVQIADNPELLKAVADSGCYTLSFGLESICKANLESFHKTWCDPSNYTEIIKKVNEAGIEVASEMIVGADGDTRESLLATVDFIKNSDIIAPKFYCLTPIPGTDLHEEMKQKGKITDFDYFSYKPSVSVLDTPNLKAAEVTECFWMVYEKLYTIPAILKRTIFHKRFLKHPKRTLFFLMVNLVYRSQIKRRISPNIL